ncbi:MAG: hypothetical protein QG635_866, partial [Bacteroidota bacterium]|nr:hypothetical protein [Bacteroidota bacterium]
ISQIIYCNGKTVWNFFRDKNKVIISNLENIENSASIEKILFDVIHQYYPKNLSIETSSSGTSLYKLLLEPSDKSKAISGISSIKLKLNKKNSEITSIEIKSDAGTQAWLIHSIKFNLKISNKAFEFKPPKGAEIVDLR